MTGPTFEERQFAALPELVQQRLMLLVRVIVGTSADEKRYSREACLVLSEVSDMLDPMPDLLRALTAVVMAAEIHARPAPPPAPVTYAAQEASDG